MSHKESIKRFLEFFDYEKNFESFVFIYNNSNDDEESEKNENINFLLRELGIDEEVEPETEYRPSSSQAQTLPFLYTALI